MSKISIAALLFCLGCTVNTSPLSPRGPQSHLFTASQGDGALVHLVGSAGSGTIQIGAERVDGSLAGSGGASGSAGTAEQVGTAGNGDSTPVNQPDSSAFTPTPDAGNSTVDAGSDTDADSGSSPSLGKTCMPCQSSTNCETGYVCVTTIPGRSNSPVCALRLPGDFGSCPSPLGVHANPSSTEGVPNVNICAPSNLCSYWLTHQEGGY
jgi:hypothetical protein